MLELTPNKIKLVVQNKNLNFDFFLSLFDHKEAQ
jgi:hypothetical protein